MQKDGAALAAPTSAELRAIEARPHGGRMMWKHPRDVSAENLKSLAASTQSPHPSVPSPYPRRGPGRGDPVTPQRTDESTSSTPSRRGFIRDYYELALDDGGVYRVFRDLATEQWFVDGIYD